VPAAIRLTCRRNVFMASILRYANIRWMLRSASVHTTDVRYFFAQDAIVIVPPYPYCIEEDRHAVALEDCWFARPQLFLGAVCVLRMEECQRTVITKQVQVYTSIYLYNNNSVYPSIYFFNHFTPDLLRELVFFNTLEELNLPITGPMEDSGVVKLYEPSPTPCLYVAPVENMVGRVPLMQLFLAGNATPTIPHLYSKHKDSGFPLGCANAAAVDSRRGSSVYEVNLWLWQFGCG
jgi:hypothetical protein